VREYLSSVSLSPTLGRNEKVEQHIRKKTRKPNALRFWVEGGVIPLYVGSVLILVRSPQFPPRILQQERIREPRKTGVEKEEEFKHQLNEKETKYT